jgi:hypothetical protein
VGDATQVSTPDAPANPQTPGTEPTLKPQAKPTSVSTPAFGVTITELPSEPAAKPTTLTGKPAANTPPSSSNPSASQAQTPAFTSEVALEAPSSVLPPSITSTLDASSVLSPDTASSGLPNLGADPSAITSPGSSAPPAVGATPKDGPEGIQSPSSATGGVLPPVTSLPDAGSVTSPGSSGTVKALGEVTVYPGVSLSDILNTISVDLSDYDEHSKSAIKQRLDSIKAGRISADQGFLEIAGIIAQSPTLKLSPGSKSDALAVVTLLSSDLIPQEVRLRASIDLIVYLMAGRYAYSNSPLSRFGGNASQAMLYLKKGDPDSINKAYSRINFLLKDLHSESTARVTGSYGAKYADLVNASRKSRSDVFFESAIEVCSYILFDSAFKLASKGLASAADRVAAEAAEKAFATTQAALLLEPSPYILRVGTGPISKAEAQSLAQKLIAEAADRYLISGQARPEMVIPVWVDELTGNAYLATSKDIPLGLVQAATDGTKITAISLRAEVAGISNAPWVQKSNIASAYNCAEYSGCSLVQIGREIKGQPTENSGYTYSNYIFKDTPSGLQANPIKPCKDCAPRFPGYVPAPKR